MTMTKKLLLVAALLLAPLAARAYECFPSGLLPQLGMGTAWRTTTTAAGFSKAWWCALPVRQGDAQGKTYWALQIFSVHNDDLDLAKFSAAAGRVATAADPKKQADAEVMAARVALTPGTQKHYEYRQLWYVACLDLRVNPPAVWDPKPDNWVGPYVTEVAWCGSPPVPPTSTEVWKATGSTIFKFAGARLTGITGRRAAAGAVCVHSGTRIVVGSFTYMPLEGGAPDEVTACAKQQ